MEFEYRSCATLHADIRGSSQFKADAHKRVLAQFINRHMMASRATSTHLFSKPMGDGLLVCANLCSDIAILALNLQQEFRTTEWKREHGFPAEAEVRIGLDFPVVGLYRDAAGNLDGSSSGLDLACRIEGVTPANTIWCTELFYKSLQSQLVTKIVGDYVGPKELAKGAGSAVLYSLRWSDQLPTPEVIATAAPEVVPDKSDVVVGPTVVADTIPGVPREERKSRQTLQSTAINAPSKHAAPRERSSSEMTTALHEVVNLLSNHYCANVVASDGVRWRRFIDDLVTRLQRPTSVVDLHDPETRGRSGFVKSILSNFGIESSVPAAPNDLKELSRHVKAIKEPLIIILHFDFFRQWPLRDRNHILSAFSFLIEKGQVAILIHSRQAFQRLIIRDDSYSWFRPAEIYLRSQTNT